MCLVVETRVTNNKCHVVLCQKNMKIRHEYTVLVRTQYVSTRHACTCIEVVLFIFNSKIVIKLKISIDTQKIEKKSHIIMIMNFEHDNNILQYFCFVFVQARNRPNMTEIASN